MNTLILIISIIIFSLLSYLAGYDKGAKNRMIIVERYKKQLEQAMFRVAELSDNLGGKCDACQGFGVTGEDGQNDCWECGGTGMKNLESYRKLGEKILNQAELNIIKASISIKNARKRFLSGQSSIK